MTAAALLFAASAAHAAITGTLIGIDGKPLAGATIQAFTAESADAQRARLLSSSAAHSAVASAESSDSGSFSIDPKTPLATLLVSVAGHPAAIRDVPDGEDAGVIVVEPAAHRRVRVTNDGKPESNALVAVGPLTLRTNAQGEVDVPEGGGRAIVVQPGFAPAEEIVGESPSAPTIALSKGVTLSGKVIAADGSPVEHARVAVDGWPLAGTNAAGQFTIANAPKNWRKITAVHAVEFGEAPDKRGAITIRLAPAVVISGVIRDPGGKAVSGARVLLRRASEVVVIPDSVISDAKGAFTFPPAAPGDYIVFAAHVGYSIAETTFSATKSVNKSIEATPFAVVRGRVVDESRAPVAGALVTFGNRAVSLGGSVLSGANGDFTVRANITPNFPQPVVAIRNGYAAGSSGPISAESAKAPLTITLPRGFPLRVKVVDKQRQAVPDAALLAFLVPDSMFRVPVVCEPALSTACRATDANGSASFRAVEGNYTFNVRGAAIAAKNVPSQALTARSSPLTIQVDRGVTVAGRVVYRDGTPVADITVMPKTSYTTMARTNPDGSFELKGIPPGPTSLIARLPNSPAPAAAVDVTAPDNNVTLTLPAPARIEGRVTDKTTGAPVADFAVVATQRDMRFYGPASHPKDFHSQDGSFSIDDAPLGSVTVRVTASGYAVQTNDVTLEEGKTVRDLAFALERGGRILGRVTADNQPVSGVSIRLGTSDPSTAMTDADGQYVLDSVTPGERIVDFSKTGFIAQHKSIEVAANKDAKLDIALSRGKELMGRVVDANGQPVVNARLFMRNAGRTVAGLGPGVFSDADGQFKFEGLADGHYSISAQKDGFVGANADGDVPSATPVIITLKTGGVITGRVTGLSDAEIGSAYVYASSPNGGARAQVDAGGTFTLRGVPDGTVNVSATAGGVSPRHSMPKTVEVTNGTAPSVDLDFAQGLTVSGHITQNGVPVGAGNINFSPKKGTQSGGSSQIGGDGSYTVSGLSTGDFLVRVFSPSVRYDADYSVSGNATFDIDMKGATLRGRVVDASTNEPVSDANVWVDPTKEVKFGQGTTSGGDGRFTLNAVPDGTFTIHASREKYSPATQSVVVASGTAPDVEVRLDRGQETVIQIVDAPSGNPIGGFVGILSGNKVVNNGSPGDDGKTHVWLPPGTYKANVSAPDYVSTRIDLTVPGPEARVPLSRAGRLIIVSKNGGDLRVGLAGLPLDSPVGGIIKTFVRAQPGISTYVGALAPGHYQVDLMNSDRVTVKQSYSVDVIAGQTATLNID